MRHLVIIVSVISALLFLVPADIFADKKSQGNSVSDFKAQSLYRAVALSWVVKTPFKSDVVFQITRSDSFVEGPYEVIGSFPYDKNKNKYDYLDKSLGSESKFYYKLIVKGTEETYGPVAARPYFSPPAT
jgi:hypothetical protein